MGTGETLLVGVGARPVFETNVATLLARFQDVRALTVALAEPLTVEDQQLQSMPDASPTKWHLGHTTWFFETLVLAPFVRGHRAYDPRLPFLFNSYYESLGPRHERARRGLVSRPTLQEVHRYRHAVDEEMCRQLSSGRLPAQALEMLELGLHHEQQHQELLLTDIKHALGTQPLRPAYRARVPQPGPSTAAPAATTWWHAPGGLVEIGHGGAGFAFDNEEPRHTVHLAPFALASRLVTCGEYLAFMADGGYERPELWLSDGWRTVQQQGWRAPLYWRQQDGDWSLFTMAGELPLSVDEPVSHVSYYEADAFARWAGARLALEAEWEHATSASPVTGNFLEGARLQPASAPAPNAAAAAPQQMFGDVWEWTASAYAPYPGFRPWVGAVGEYNGKFMCNQMVLRGGSCFTPSSHMRRTYRNFFFPDARWQMTGIRLARDA